MARKEEIAKLLNEKCHDEVTIRDIFKGRHSLLLTSYGFNLICLHLPELVFTECKLEKKLTISQTLKLKKINSDIYYLDKDYRTIYTTCPEFMGLYKLLQGNNEDIFSFV